MKRFAIPLVLLSVGFVSELPATVTTRHYNFEQGAAGAAAPELIDIVDAMTHENPENFNFPWGAGHIWIEVSGVEGRPLPGGSLRDVVPDAALTAPSLMLGAGQGRYVDVSNGSALDSPAVGSKLAIQFDGATTYDDSLTAAGSRGVYVSPAAYAAGDDVAGGVNVSESFNLMIQGWIYPQRSNGEKQTVWQAGSEQGSVNITEDGFWQFEDLGSVGIVNCPDAEGPEIPYSCEQGQFPVEFGKWTHIGILRGGNGAQIYLNGQHVAGNINPTPPNFFGGFANQITIGGRQDGTNGFIGLIDDFKVHGEVSIGVHDMDYPGEVVSPTVPGDFDGNGQLTAADIDLLSAQVAGGLNPTAFDLNSDNLVNGGDRDVWVEGLKKTYYGDADLNGVFDSGDFVVVFQQGQYEDGVAGNSGWASGDWNGDKEFDSGDFVAAFQAGGYEQGPRAAVSAVPEPASLTMLCLAGLSLLGLRRRR